MTTATTAPLSGAAIEALNARFATAPAEEIIAWAAAEFPGGLAVSCSFGGSGGIVLVDLALRVELTLPVVYVDTDYLFDETHATRHAVEERYGVRALAFRSALTPETQAALHGPALWERDPDLCCALRKVEPMRVALAGFSAYLTALRRDQAETRRETPLVQWDDKFGLLKLNPLAAWTEPQVWAHIVANKLPYNPLHDRGYPSIGCTNCTRAVAPGDDPRSGRWSGSGKVECGLHTA